MILTEQQIMIRDMARDFASQEMAPHVRQWEQDDEPPVWVLKKLGELGLMGACISTEYGGAGVDFVSYVLATEEIARADCGVCNMMNVHNSPICAAVQDYGSDPQKKSLLPRMASGELIGTFLLTEPQAGSDAAAITTTARAVDGGYILNGTKQFITSGKTADVAMVVAVTDPEAGRKGMSCFITPTDNPGYIVTRVEDKLGHRTCDTCQITMEDMFVPDTDLLGPSGEGYKIALAYLMGGRIGVSAQSVGVAQAALDAAADYARERETFGKRLVDHQAIAFKLADMATQVESARQMVLHAAQLKDAGVPCLKEASMAKLHASVVAEQVCSEAVQIHGGYGFLSDYIVEKLYRDARVLQIYEGASEVQKMLISREFSRD